MKTLGDHLRDAREKKNFTQIQVAKQTGINNKTISNYENNVSYPDPETLKVLSNLYETSVDTLLGLTNVHKSGETNTCTSIDVSGLPEEAVKLVEDYAELLKLKYKSGRRKKEE